MSAPHPLPYKSAACTFLLLWMSVFLSADLFAGSFRTLGIKEGLGSRQVFIRRFFKFVLFYVLKFRSFKAPNNDFY